MTKPQLPPIETRIADELDVSPEQVEAAVQLLDEGATVPFIARYRKERTRGLDDVQLRKLEERLGYLRELEDRRASVLKAVGADGKLTPELERAIALAETKVALEDLYRPFKKKRKTKAQEARAAGLAPLAASLLADPDQDPTKLAGSYLAPDAGFADADAVLAGAREVLMEELSENASVLQTCRNRLRTEASLCARPVAKKKDDPEAARYRDYLDRTEDLANAASHRVLAMLRADREGFLKLRLGIGDDGAALTGDPDGFGEATIRRAAGIEDRGRKADAFLGETVKLAYKKKVAPQLERELLRELREKADVEAIDVFASNLRDLLLAAPAGPRVILGLDPGLRTGVKVAVVDATGKVLATETIYPHAPKKDRAGALKKLGALCERFDVQLVAIGNGTASRETDELVGELMEGREDLKKIVVSEAGASVYSASELASHELSELDVSLRGAVSIARRLQDPLAELVKIDPKAIGVGQYQHDVDQDRLAKSLDTVVEDCVNLVGVDVNTASPALLSRVAGLNEKLAENIVRHRDANGRYASRRELLDVPRLGKRAFEQCAGFLRIQDGKDPLDSSAVHPEAYPVVKRILKQTKRKLDGVLGDATFLRSLAAEDFTDDRFGTPTVTDILRELEKPGRDPRPEFRTASFTKGVEELSDLRPGMTLEGVVSNVTNFGAFVDVGVHTDGLVHVSQLADRFVEDPHEVVRAGEVVRVKVLEVDEERKRVSLSLRLDAEVQGTPKDKAGEAKAKSAKKSGGKGQEPPAALPAQPDGSFRAQLDKLRDRLN